MTEFVSIKDQEGWVRLANVSEISEITPYQKDWREGAIVTMKRGFTMRLNAEEAQDLRYKLTII